MSVYNDSYNEIEVNKNDELLWIYLNSPKTHNALSNEMINELINVLQKADRDKEIRAIILGGRGKSFCAGGDIKAMLNQSGMFSGDSDELRLRYTHGIQMIPKTIEGLETPIIAFVEGAAVGAGMDLACMCDFRICTENAKFSGSFSKLGLVPGDGGTYFLSRLVGYAKAMEIYMIGDFFDAKEAYSINMITKIIDSKDEENDVKNFAKKISKNAPIALALTKKALKSASHEPLLTHLDRLSTYQGIAQRTQDHKEGVKALLAKRKPEFKSF